MAWFDMNLHKLILYADDTVICREKSYMTRENIQMSGVIKEKLRLAIVKQNMCA